MTELTSLFRLIAPLVIRPGWIVEPITAAARRLVIFTVCAALGAFLILPAIGCAAAGLWMLMESRMGPVKAAFITAGAFVLLAIMLFVIDLFFSRKPKTRMRRATVSQNNENPGPTIPEISRFSAKAKTLATTEALRARAYFARNKAAFLVGASVAGLIVGQDRFRRPRRSIHKK